MKSKTIVIIFVLWVGAIFSMEKEQPLLQYPIVITDPRLKLLIREKLKKRIPLEGQKTNFILKDRFYANDNEMVVVPSYDNSKYYLHKSEEKSESSYPYFEIQRIDD